MNRSEVVISLETIGDMLADPLWLERARKAKTAKDLKQLLLDYCAVNGKLVKIGEGLTCLYSAPSRQL